MIRKVPDPGQETENRETKGREIPEVGMIEIDVEIIEGGVRAGPGPEIEVGMTARGIEMITVMAAITIGTETANG